jgi:hypothetical protein
MGGAGGMLRVGESDAIGDGNGTVLGGTVLGGTVLDGTVLGGTVLGGTVLGGTVPAGVIPAADAEGSEMPGTGLPSRVVPHFQQAGNCPITCSPHFGHFQLGLSILAGRGRCGMGNRSCIARSKSGGLTCTCTRAGAAPSGCGSGSNSTEAIPAVSSLLRISSASTAVRRAATVSSSSDMAKP